MADFDPNSADGNDTAIKGGSDSTIIGNVVDALKVSVSNTVPIATTETEAATFTVYGLGIAIGNNKSMMSIANASGSSVKIRIREIRIINVQNTAVTGVIADYRLLRCTSHSSGTAITPLAHDTSDTALSSSVTAKTGATITGEAADPLRRYQLSTDEWGTGASDVESNSHDIQMNNSLFQTAPKTETITLNANEGITLKQVTNSTAGTFDILMVFTQG